MDGESIRKAAGLCGGVGVCVGAFGAHALKEILESRGTLVSQSKRSNLHNVELLFTTLIQSSLCKMNFMPLFHIELVSYWVSPTSRCLRHDNHASRVQYHLLHSAALLALSSASKGTEHSLTAKLWIAGISLFSGSIYGLSLGGPRVLGKARV